jgi:predicted ATPase/DNA-binding winged helix-turn-helix (wHTH) protein
MSVFYGFGAFILNSDERRLYRDGLPAPLGPTAVSVLSALVQKAGTVVSKDDLISHVWGNAVVGDSRLHVHIHELRKVVGDDFIVTKPGQGYRFTAPVHRQSRLPQLAGKDDSARLAEVRPQGVQGLSLVLEHLIGRTDEVRLVSEHVHNYGLTTLTGPGGVGKTSLALHVAAVSASYFPDGVWLVELASLNESAHVAGAVATALGIKLGQSRAPLETLARQLSNKDMLLVLDNCEHVLSTAAVLCETLLAATRNLAVLATSREPLSCSGERVFKVPPLAVPDDRTASSSAIRDTPSVKLFVEGAKKADTDFQINDVSISLIAKICRHVDGLPLAIEMVSRSAGILGLDTLAAKLNGSQQTWLRARSTAPLRHSTLRSTLEWSHDLLSVHERVVFRRLGVFADTFKMEAAQAVCSDEKISGEEVFELVANLARKSLVVVIGDSQQRNYRLLETTRAFAREKLMEAEDRRYVRERHAAFIRTTLERATEEWETTADAIWLKRYSSLLGDLRDALNWAGGQTSDDTVALAGLSWPLWRELSLLVEGRSWLSAAVSQLRPDTPAVLEARLRIGLGALLNNYGSPQKAHDEFARAVDLCRMLGARQLLGLALSRQAFALLLLGRTKEAQHVVAESISILESGYHPRTLAAAYSASACVEATLHHHRKARAIGEEAAKLCQSTGALRAGFNVRSNLIESSMQIGDLDRAISDARVLIGCLRDTFHSDVLGYAMGLLAAALTERGELDEALAVAREAVPLLRDDGPPIFDHLALRAGLAGKAKEAARLIGYAESVHNARSRPREPIERRAATRLSKVLRAALAQKEISSLKREGAGMTEDQATALALQA